MPDPNDLASQQIADTEAGYDPYKRSLPPVRVLGMTGQQDYPGAIGLPVAGGGAGNALAQRQMITAYHGSPHDFDEFDASKIGTGEGAQSYGHGLYFAEHPEVALDYKASLAAKQTSINRLALAKDAAEKLGVPSKYMPEYVLKQLENGTPIDDIYGKMSADPIFRGRSPQDMQASIDYVKKNFPDHAAVAGNLYEVGIDAHPDEFLDWDKPLSEQSGHVQTAVGKVVDRDISQETGWRKLTGQQVLGAAVERGGSRGGGEAALHAAGIKGIRYLDQGSRGEGQGTHNYVIFDPKTVSIMKKNGIDVVRGNAAMEGE